MTQDGKVAERALQSLNAPHRELGYELNPAARRDLDARADAGGIVADENDRIPVDQCPGRTRIECQADNDVSVWTAETSRNDDQSALRVGRNSYNTTAVSSGSVPVYRIAECCGRNSRAFR